MPAADERVAALLQFRKILGTDDADVESLGRTAVSAITVRRNQRAQHLLGVGVDDDGRLHVRIYLGGDWGGAKAGEDRR